MESAVAAAVAVAPGREQLVVGVEQVLGADVVVAASGDDVVAAEVVVVVVEGEDVDIQLVLAVVDIEVVVE